MHIHPSLTTKRKFKFCIQCWDLETQIPPSQLVPSELLAATWQFPGVHSYCCYNQVCPASSIWSFSPRLSKPLESLFTFQIPGTFSERQYISNSVIVD